MARPEKKRAPVVEMVDEPNVQLEAETGVTGAEQGTARENEQGLACAHAPTTYNRKQLQDAVTAHVAAARLALDVRKVAREHAQKESLAKRLHDAKMRRLDNGEKRKRGACSMKRAFRTYEAILDMDEATIQCARWMCRAAERERDALAAEIRVQKLEIAMLRRALQ